MKKQKLLFTVVLYCCLAYIYIFQYNLSTCLATDILSKKELQKLINDKKFDYEIPEEAFIRAFNFLLNEQAPKKMTGVRIKKNDDTYTNRAVVGFGSNKTEIKIMEYKNLFGRSYDSNITEKQRNVETILVNSICAFYEIGRDELIKIRKEKKLISRKKKEINQLFENCLELIDKKFIKNEAVLNEDRIIKSITEKLIENQDKSVIPTVPTYPSTLI